MTTHEQTRELISTIKRLIAFAESGTLEYSDLELARKLVFHAQIELDRLPTEDEVKDDLKEIAHYFGGWPELRKEIESLEDNDNEAAWERRMSDYDAPSANEQAEMMHRVKRDLK